jgi:formylglycine-generating enzyme required for sulfatase activity
MKKLQFVLASLMILLGLLSCDILSSSDPASSDDTTAPSNPTALTSTAGDTQITLNWANPPETDFDAVEISWTPSGGSPEQPLTLASTATGQTITGLTNGTSYRFTVKSMDSEGNTSSGVRVTGTPRLADLTSTTVGNLKSVEGGTFNNGTSDVTVSTFYMSETEITQHQYTIVTGNSPSQLTGSTSRPVENVTWYDAVEFCNGLSTLEGLTPVYTIAGRSPQSGYPITSAVVTMNLANDGYRLPTEAEWEFAARGGNSTNGYTYSGSNSIDDVAWYSANSSGTTHPVAGKAANELGLYDMSGNVWEWCWDWSDYYPTGAQINPTGASSSLKRVGRGGGWNGDAAHGGSADRLCFSPVISDYAIGFRVVRPSF